MLRLFFLTLCFCFCGAGAIIFCSEYFKNFNITHLCMLYISPLLTQDQSSTKEITYKNINDENTAGLNDDNIHSDETTFTDGQKEFSSTETYRTGRAYKNKKKPTNGIRTTTVTIVKPVKLNYGTKKPASKKPNPAPTTKRPTTINRKPTPLPIPPRVPINGQTPLVPKVNETMKASDEMLTNCINNDWQIKKDFWLGMAVGAAGVSIICLFTCCLVKTIKRRKRPKANAPRVGTKLEVHYSAAKDETTLYSEPYGLGITPRGNGTLDTGTRPNNGNIHYAELAIGPAGNLPKVTEESPYAEVFADANRAMYSNVSVAR